MPHHCLIGRYQYAPLADELPEAHAVMENAATALHEQQQRAAARLKASLLALATAAPFAACPAAAPGSHTSGACGGGAGSSRISGDSRGNGSSSSGGETNFGCVDTLGAGGGEVELGVRNGGRRLPGGKASSADRPHAKGAYFPAFGPSDAREGRGEEDSSSTDEESQMIV